MKYQFLKSALILGSVLAFVNCTDDATDVISNLDPNANQPSENDPSAVPADDPCWLINADQPYLIYPAGIVTDLKGNPVATFVFTDENYTTGNMIAADGSTIILNNIALDNLTVVTRATASMALPPSSSAAIETPASSADVTPTVSSSSTGTTPTSSETAANNDKSSSSEEKQVATSSATQTPITDGKVTITGSLTQTVAQKASTGEIKFSGLSNEPTRLSWNAYFLETSYSNGTYTIKAITVPEYFEVGEVSEFFKVEGKDYEFKITVTKAGSGSTSKSSSSQQQQKSSSSQQAKSSSSQQAKSSSSQQAKSSSSVQPVSSSSKQVVTTGCPTIKTKGGASGSGFASRYWDGCKPSCSWKNNAGSAGPAKQCSRDGKTASTNYDEQSVCSGGGAATCTSQIPFTIDGCDNIGFAFAAVPASNGGQCGKCFQLTFTGKGKYETKGNHKKLEGKKLIVMVTNIGADVNQGQFDVMIPGGGVGLYNGTSGYNWGSQGAQYGGLLTDCEKEAGTAGDVTNKRKECLIKKCNSSFGSDTQAKEGCLFLANFMEAAGNPTHNYTEVECPEVLKSKY